MKRLNCGFIKWWNRTIWEEKIGIIMTILLVISLIIIIVKSYESVLFILTLSIVTLVLFPFGILYCTILVFMGETLFQLVKDKLKSHK